VKAAFRKAIGVPEKADDYKISAPEGFPADRWDKEFEGRVPRASRTREGLIAGGRREADDDVRRSPGQGVTKAIATARANTLPNLKKEWGADFEKNNAAADQAIEAYARKAGFTDDDLGMIAAGGLGEKFMRLMASFGGEGVAMGGVGAEAQHGIRHDAATDRREDRGPSQHDRLLRQAACRQSAADGRIQGPAGEAPMSKPLSKRRTRRPPCPPRPASASPVADIEMHALELAGRSVVENTPAEDTIKVAQKFFDWTMGTAPAETAEASVAKS